MRSKPPPPPTPRPPSSRPATARPGAVPVRTSRPAFDRAGSSNPDSYKPDSYKSGPAQPGFARPAEAKPSPAAPHNTDELGTKTAFRVKTPRDRGGGPRPSRPPEPGSEQVRRLGQARPAPAVVAEPVPPPAPRPETLRAVAVPVAAAPVRERVAPGGAPRGSVWLHGLHAVAAALANPARRVKRLVLTEEAEATLTERLPQPWPAPVERVVRAKLDTLLGRDTVHQGAALLADLLTPPSLASVLERPGPVLVLDQVTDPRNVGAVLRSAAAFGVAGVITQDRNSPEETGVLAKAASGALETMPLIRAVNLARTLAALKAAGFWVVGLDAAGAPFRGGPLQERRVALVLGAEGAGLRRLTRETCDELAGLAMPGVMESLNVSAAATVALYELTRGGG